MSEGNEGTEWPQPPSLKYALTMLRACREMEKLLHCKSYFGPDNPLKLKLL